MSYCPQCGHKVTPDAQFCANCGTNIKESLRVAREHKPGAARPKDRQDGHPQQRPAREQQQSNEAGVAAYRALMVVRSAKRIKAFVLIGVGGMCAIFGVLIYAGGMHLPGLILGVPGAIALLMGLLLTPPERLTQEEYTGLPGATSANGHQCIFCGGRGVYRHTPYKTTTTLADCSHCKNELWSEPAAG